MNDVWMWWKALRPGTQFIVLDDPMGHLYVKLRDDPFGARIGCNAIVRVCDGADMTLTELVNPYQRSIEVQVKLIGQES